MPSPAQYDITWVRGTTTPLVFAIKRNGVPIPFDDIRLSVFKNKGKDLAFRASYADGTGIIVVDALQGLVKFTPSAAQTRSLTVSKDDVTPMNKYELEYRDGASEEVYLRGNVVGLGGINDDEEIS